MSLDPVYHYAKFHKGALTRSFCIHIVKSAVLTSLLLFTADFNYCLLKLQDKNIFILSVQSCEIDHIRCIIFEFEVLLLL
jgi:hypothetical protein